MRVDTPNGERHHRCMTNPDECSHPFFSIDALAEGSGMSAIKKVYCGRCEMLVGYFRAEVLQEMAERVRRTPGWSTHHGRPRPRSHAISQGCEPRVHGCS
jgi:hypothetical protein